MCAFPVCWYPMRPCSTSQCLTLQQLRTLRHSKRRRKRPRMDSVLMSRKPPVRGMHRLLAWTISCGLSEAARTCACASNQQGRAVERTCKRQYSRGDCSKKECWAPSCRSTLLWQEGNSISRSTQQTFAEGYPAENGPIFASGNATHITVCTTPQTELNLTVAADVPSLPSIIGCNHSTPNLQTCKWSRRSMYCCIP